MVVVLGTAPATQLTDHTVQPEPGPIVAAVVTVVTLTAAMDPAVTLTAAMDPADPPTPMTSTTSRVPSLSLLVPPRP